MKVIIEGQPKEISALVLSLQERKDEIVPVQVIECGDRNMLTETNKCCKP